MPKDDDEMAVVPIGTPGSYTPKVALSNLLECADDIEFLVIGVAYKNGNASGGWTAHEDAFPLTSYLTDMIKEKCMRKSGDV